MPGGRSARATSGPPPSSNATVIIPLVYRGSAVLISAEGRALDRAGPGETIRVMNISSRNTVTAVAAANGLAYGLPVTRPKNAQISLVALMPSGGLHDAGQFRRPPPALDSTPMSGNEYSAMVTPPLQDAAPLGQPRASTASLWTGDPNSLLGDRRAMQRGDILTVVIEIDDSARDRTIRANASGGSENLTHRPFSGFRSGVDGALPDGPRTGGGGR